jgi:hypothetical protein
MPRTRSIEAIERDARAVELRRRGLNYRQIAGEMGWASQKSAYQAVQRGLADSVSEANEEVRRLELDKLDEWQRHALRVLAKPHYAVSQGVVVTLKDGDGKETPVDDDMPILHAIDRLLKISERRSRLLGLDAPAKSRVEVITEDAVDAEIKRLTEELAGLADAKQADHSGTA